MLVFRGTNGQYPNNRRMAASGGEPKVKKIEIREAKAARRSA